MEIQQLVTVSQKGELNSTDRKSMLWYLLIQVCSGIVTGLIAFLAYLTTHSEGIPAWLIVLIPVSQIVLTQIGDALHKLLDGPTKEQVKDIQEGYHVEGYTQAKK